MLVSPVHQEEVRELARSNIRTSTTALPPTPDLPSKPVFDPTSDKDHSGSDTADNSTAAGRFVRFGKSTLFTGRLVQVIARQSAMTD